MHDKQNMIWKCQWPTFKIISLCLLPGAEEGTYVFSNGPYGQIFIHGDSTNVLFITMEINGQLDIKKTWTTLAVIC
jgi:hypothetical protein